MKNAILTQYFKDVPQHIIDAELDRIEKAPVSDYSQLNYSENSEIRDIICHYLNLADWDTADSVSCQLFIKEESVSDYQYFAFDYHSSRLFSKNSDGYWDLLGLMISIRECTDIKSNSYHSFVNYLAPTEIGIYYLKKGLEDFYNNKIEELKQSIIDLKAKKI